MRDYDKGVEPRKPKIGMVLFTDCKKKLPAIELTPEIYRLISTGCALSENELDDYSFYHGTTKAIAFNDLMPACCEKTDGIIDESP